MKVIVKPTQSGKTAVIIKLIQEEFLDDELYSEVKHLNFIFNANNLLLTKQTKGRFKKDINDILHDVIEFSSNASSDAKTVYELLGFLTFDDVSNIMVCNNSRRVNDIIEVIHKLNSKHNYTINIWVDEADNFIKSLKEFQKLLEYKNINLWAITATPQNIFDVFGEQHIYKLKDTTAPNYHGWNDNNINIRENTKTSIEFIAPSLMGWVFLLQG